ncbi:hypothetical protein BU14_0255s0015 [Porphyra umbilicalis]|uniref:valine--tRNA ligase n=1 Tax=Porphyra umbilicalis TaxID=2786 RepID=A0A1X6P2P9_PORUM|nr:hypothetical protein BU14_0255s0015 [Porphyra umbilicalis]|eukprot:OSX75108.1 hypothetical protein BU14_0255s0015 [Porphyra umbilicalis]
MARPGRAEEHRGHARRARGGGGPVARAKASVILRRGREGRGSSAINMAVVLSKSERGIKRGGRRAPAPRRRRPRPGLERPRCAAESAPPWDAPHLHSFRVGLPHCAPGDTLLPPPPSAAAAPGAAGGGRPPLDASAYAHLPPAVPTPLPLPDVVRGAAGVAMPTKYDPQAVEGALYEWWSDSDLFAPRAPKDPSLRPFTIMMPPPNVTGGLHMGHAMFVALEDILVRYHRMKGHATLWLPGTDHAGIATQLLVERSLAADGLDRQTMGRDAFLERVWEWKRAKGGYITQQLRRLGASCDWKRERFTLDAPLSAAVTEAFVRLHDKGLIYRGEYMVNWSPNLRTAVSDLEVEFSEEQGTLYYFNYPVADSDEVVPVATSRPETILGDTALCVHPEDPRYAHLVGRRAVVPETGGRTVPIIADTYVDREFGTGALKITPGHDPNDYEIGKRHHLPIISLLNKDGTMNEAAGDFAGQDRAVARASVWAAMQASGLALRTEPHTQRVPRSQRGGEIIEPLVSTQWFVRTASLAAPAAAAVRDGRVKVVPPRFEKADARAQADAKYGAGAAALTQDDDVLDTWFSSGLWPFSALGWPEETPDLAAFYPNSVMETGYDILFFWVARMMMLGMGLTDGATPPFDTIYLHGLVRDGSGRKMSKTVGNVVDPLETIALYGTDALRYSLVTGSTPGQDVPLSMEKVEANRNFANKLWNACRYVLGVVDGEADAAVVEALGARAVGGWTAEELSALALPERHIIGRLHKLVDAVSAGLDTLAFGESARHIHDFLWDEFADWYVETSKTRFWASAAGGAAAGGDGPGGAPSPADVAKQQADARATLVYVLDTCLRLLHPFMPYVTEALWQRFPRSADQGEPALITAAWPAGGPVDADAIRRFERLQALVRSVRNARAEYRVEPGARVPLTVYAAPEAAADVRAEAAMLGLLAKVDVTRLVVTDVTDGSLDGLGAAAANGNGGGGGAGAGAGAGAGGDGNGDGVPASTAAEVHLVVADGLRAVLPMAGLVDFAKERARLDKQVGKLEADRAGLERRLSAPSFADKAPAAVVAATKAAAADLDEQLGSLRGRLAELRVLAEAEE